MKSIVVIWLIFTFSDLFGQEWTKTAKMSLLAEVMSGDTAIQMGDLAKAERKYLAAEKRIEECKQDNSIRISVLSETIFTPLNRLGRIYLLTNNLNKAEFYFETAQEYLDQYLPKRSIFRAVPLTGLAEVRWKQNNLQSAKVLLNRAEKLIHRSFSGLVEYETFLKPVYRLRFEVALAEDDLKTASKYVHKLSAGGASVMDFNSKMNVPLVFEMRARYYLHLGDYDLAEINLRRAEAFATVLKNKQIDFQVGRTRALLNWSRNDIEAALRAFMRLNEAYKIYVHRNFAALSEYEREVFYSQLKSDFDLFNAFAIQNNHHELCNEMFRAVYDNQLFGKAILLNQISKLKEKILNGDDDRLIRLVDEWENQKAFLSSLYFQKRPRLHMIEDTEQGIYDLEKEITQRSNFLDDIRESVNWRDVVARLAKEEVAVEIIRVTDFRLGDGPTGKFSFGENHRYLVLTLRNDSLFPEHTIINDGNSLEGTALNLYRNSIRYKLSDNESYNRYWRPISESVGQAKKMFLSADGALTQISLLGLKNPEAGSYVLDEMDVMLVTNTKDIVSMEVSSNDKRAVLMGRPDYLIKNNKDTLAMLNEQLALRTFTGTTFKDFKDQLFIDLPGTEKEVLDISQLLLEHGWRVSPHFGSEASESNLKKETNPTILHIATHGFFLPENNWDGVNSMIRSGLLLSGVDRLGVDAHDDGVLTAYEATNLKLDSTLLVALSACETGLGEVRNGEGVYGLQRGFSVAGARYVLMSLWKVDDRVTQTLMTQFYTHWLSGNAIHEAFALAQKRVRETHDHPFYWASFVLIGI